MGARLTLVVSMLAISAAALGCSAAKPSLQPSEVSSQGPTPTDVTTTLPTSTPDAGQSPLVGCLGPRPDLAAILAIDPSRRPACFGQSDVTFLADGTTAEVECGPGQVEPAWLWCPPAAFLAPPGRAKAATMLAAYLAPGSGLDQAQFVPGAIVQVTGHFDDPAAAACRIVRAAPPEWPVLTPAEVVLACREAFVVTSVRRESA